MIPGVPPPSGEPPAPEVNGVVSAGSVGSMTRQTFLYKGTGAPNQIIKVPNNTGVLDVVVFLFEENVGAPSITNAVLEPGVDLNLNMGEYPAGKKLRIIVFG